LNLGSNNVVVTACDGNGKCTSCTIVVNVIDTTPPAITALTATPCTLWPPNCRLVPVTITGVFTDGCSHPPSCSIQTVLVSTLPQDANHPGDGGFDDNGHCGCPDDDNGQGDDEHDSGNESHGPGHGRRLLTHNGGTPGGQDDGHDDGDDDHDSTGGHNPPPPPVPCASRPDFQITGNYTVLLKAQRPGNCGGKVYTIVFGCVDGSHNTVTQNVVITVPHNQ